jgi:membrane-bound lytic murein transglycosylase D
LLILSTYECQTIKDIIIKNQDYQNMQMKYRKIFYYLLWMLAGQAIIVTVLLLLELSVGFPGYSHAARKIAALQQEIIQLQQQVQQAEQRSYVNSHQLPLPVVFCGDTLDMTNPLIRERLEREFYLLLNEQGQIQLYLKRWARYLPMIENCLKQANLPDDLKYIAIHESALLPNVRSRANAVGLWQFMRATGRLYNLRINRYIDERREVEKATAAAVTMFRDLKNILGNWPLVLAAYNVGIGRVLGEMNRQRTNSFFDLSLPEETERYFFKIVAIRIVLSQPEKFGFQIENDDFYYKDSLENISYRVESQPISIPELAASLGLNSSQLKTYNPHLVNSYLPSGIFELKIPLANYQQYLQRQRKMEEVFSGNIMLNKRQINVE